jgi:hypothetical protein
MNVTIYKRPDGRSEVIDCRNVYPDDAKWFEDNHVAISMEDIGGGFAVYADTGKEVDGEPDELIELSQGRTCEETLHALREQCEGVIKC